jgi:hypothetical protein
LRSGRDFKATADRNGTVGEFNSGVCCYRAEGIPIDFGEGVKYFRLSSKLNIEIGELVSPSCLFNIFRTDEELPVPIPYL